MRDQGGEEPGDEPPYPRRNAWVLGAVFALALVFGLLRGNLFAVLGGAGGLLWLIWQMRKA